MPAASALDMGVPANRKIRYTDVAHTGNGNYVGRTGVVTRADDALAKPDS